MYIFSDNLDIFDCAKNSVRSYALNRAAAFLLCGSTCFCLSYISVLLDLADVGSVSSTLFSSNL